jgi:hypothetical protein
LRSIISQPQVIHRVVPLLPTEVCSSLACTFRRRRFDREGRVDERVCAGLIEDLSVHGKRLVGADEGFNHEEKQSRLNEARDLQQCTNMKKVTTTKATHRGIEIAVMSENTGHGTTYSCTNTSGRPKLIDKWFATQGEAIANERLEIDEVLG